MTDYLEDEDFSEVMDEDLSEFCRKANYTLAWMKQQKREEKEMKLAIGILDLVIDFIERGEVERFRFK